VARVAAVDPERQVVTVADAGGGGELGYDTLVYAVGSHVAEHGVPGVASTPCGDGDRRALHPPYLLDVNGTRLTRIGWPPSPLSGEGSKGAATKVAAVATRTVEGATCRSSATRSTSCAGTPLVRPDGIVSPAGWEDNYNKKWAADRAVLRVKGVQAVDAAATASPVRGGDDRHR
jgi:hypothetical protein